ncbi:MAG: VCBS repeat-containing protein [Planctomycetota bacterium]
MRFFASAGILFLLHLQGMASGLTAGEFVPWNKHIVTEGLQCNTAVALDVNGDPMLDVIANVGNRVVLFVAPTWEEQFVLHRFDGVKQGIHCTLIDVDNDGDMDWAGTVAQGHPFWLENPGADAATMGPWVARPIDHDVTGTHCLLAADIDNDGADDLVINNFLPDKGLRDSMAWFKVPENPHEATQWERYVFADKDARGGSHYMGAADIDGDGWKEIAVGAKGGPFEDGNWFAFWTHPGEQGMKGPWKKTVLAEGQIAATNILPADVNGDGKIDWVASRGHGIGVLWFENPSWRIHSIDEVIEFPHSLTVADHDQDGDLDIASCGYGSETVMWYQNDGSGEFSLHRIDEEQQSYDLRSVDMDGDGDLDLINAGRATGNVVWYENPLK